MSPLAAPAANLDFLDRLMASDDVWIQAAEEGRVVARHILDSTAKILVLYGPARGSTDFLRRWVVPELGPHLRVVFHERGAEPAAAAADADIELWDGVEAWISEPDASGRGLLDYVGRSSSASHKSVLILQEDYLNRLFQLRQTIPGILDDLFEIPPMPAARFIDAVRRTVSRYGVPIEEACCAALARDLDAVRTAGALGPELVAILAFEILRVSHAGPAFTTAEYQELGGLKGILGRHIDFLLEHVPGGDEAIGWAVLQRAARTPVDVVTDLTDVAHRFDVPIEVPHQVLAWLEHDRRVLSANTGGGHDIVPGLLGLAVAAHAARIDELTENARALLRHGVRQFAESGGLLTDQQFRRINEQRSALTTTEDEATLMLRCAFGHSEAGNQHEIEHWLRRVRSEATKIDILVDMLFDIRPELRARAATALRQFNTPDVRGQLHLVALRESDDAVRGAAVDSLGVLQTREVRSDLIRETSDPNSPFQLQAIDALRVFPEQEAVDALVHIVSGAAPGHDRHARARAINALGAQNTDASRLALVRIAIEDPDADDRDAAVAALGAAPTQAAAAHILANVSEPPASSAASEVRSFWLDAGQATRLTLAALAAMIGNTLVHGLLLITIGRRRAGGIITAAGAVFFTLALAGYPLVTLLWLLSFVTGYLMPTRLLLRRRTDGDPMTPYQCSVGRALFLAGCVTGFLVVHGLPSMLTRHVKRGLTLTAFEVAGLVLILLSRLWHADLELDQAALREVFWRTHAATWTLFGMGVAIFATTYVLGIRTAAADLFTSRTRRTEAARRDAIYQALLSNPHAVAVVVNDLQSLDPARAEAAIGLCERYTRILRPALRARWEQADEALKARIAAMISRQPDQASIELLQSAARTRAERHRAARAMWKLRLAIWPPVARVAVLIGLVTLVSYVVMLHEMHTNSAPVLLEAARQEDGEDQVRAIRTLGALAQARPPQVERELAVVLDLPSTNTDARRATIDALKSLGTAEAADVLRHFVERAGGEPADRTEINELKSAAISALGHMQSVWALIALMELSTSTALTADISAKASEAAGTIDPLAWSEYYLERSKFDEAIQAANSAMSRATGPESVAKAGSALADVYTIRGLAAYERGDYGAAMRDLTGALDARAPATSLGGAIALAQQLGYRLHETEALVDPAAFETSYRVYKRIQPISRHFGEAFAIDIEANLAESALTSGRFDEALQLARSVAERAGAQPESAGFVIPMRIVEAAALALQGDDATAKGVLEGVKGLKAPANTTWQYDGTLHYLASTRLSPEVRRLLREAIHRAARAPAAAG